MKKKKIFTIFVCVVALMFVSSISWAQDYKSSLRHGAKELVDQRTEYSKTFLNTDNSFTTVIFTYKIHNKNSKGQFEEINTDNESDLTGTIGVAYYKPHFHSSDWESGYYNSTQFGYDNWNNVDKQKRSYVWWSTSSIPSSATITSTSIHFDRNTSNYSDFKIRKMTTNYPPPPEQHDAFTVWQAIYSGQIYLSTNSSASSFYFVSDDQQNTAFKNDLQSRLTQGWMEMGLTNDNELDYDHYLTYTSQYLTVFWTAPQQLCVTPQSWTPPNPYPGNSTTIYVTNCGGGSSFQFSVTNNNPDWITVSNIQNNTPGHFDLSVSANYTCYQRTGTVSVIANGIQGSPKTVTVTQNAASQITLPTQAVAGLQQYNSTDWITVNNFVVSQNGDVQHLTLIASNSIYLNPGFIANSDGNCTFNATIQHCGPEFSLDINGKSSDVDIHTNNLVKNASAEFNQINLKPSEYSLSQNFPNPFNPTTYIKYALKDNCGVILKVYDILGRQIAILINEYQEAGFKVVHWDASDLPSGIYFYKLIAGKFVQSKKMLLLK